MPGLAAAETALKATQPRKSLRHRTNETSVFDSPGLVFLLQDCHVALVEIDLTKEFLKLVHSVNRHQRGAHFVFTAIFQDVAGALRLAAIVAKCATDFRRFPHL